MKYLSLCLLLWAAHARAQELTIHESKTLKDQPDYVRMIKFSPFGNYIAVSIGNNTTELYDKNWTKLFTSQGDPKSLASQCVFTPDERFLLFSKYHNSADVAIFSILENRVVQTLQDHESMINTIALSLDGQSFATGGNDDFFLIYTLVEGKFKQTQKFTPSKNRVQALTFSPDSKELFAGLYEKVLQVYQKKDMQWSLAESLPSESSIEDIVISPDGKRVAASDSYSNLFFYHKSGSSYKLAQTVETERAVECLSFSPDGRYLVGGLSHGCIQIWKMSAADTLKELRKLYRHDNRVLDIDFSADGRNMSTSSYDKTGIVWALEGVKASDKSVIGSILGSDMTMAQRKILNGVLSSQIIQAIEPPLLLPKDEFETNMDFLKRREKLKSQLTAQLQEKMEGFYGLEKKGATLETKLDKVVSYDADRQLYFLLFMETAGKAKIPANEAKSLKENWQKAKVTIQKSKDKNGETLYKKFTLLHPTLNKQYEIEVTENPFQPGSNNSEKERSSASEGEIKKLTIADTSGKKSYTGTNYALLFATNDYDNYNDLTNPVYDAKAVADELQRNYGFNTEIVENATLDVILKKLKRYAQLSYDKEDQLFVFFAGHGKYDEIFREGYLVAKESKLQDDARTTFLSHSNLRTIINNIDCEHIFLVMDVCFGGTFDPYITAHRGDELYEEVPKTEFIERKMKHKTRLYLTSGGKEYVPDGRPGEHSPFARKLLEALRSYGGKDAILTVSEIISYVEKVVPQPRTGEFGNNEPGSDFVFVAK